MKNNLLCALLLGLAGCSSFTPTDRRQFVDSTTHSDSAPSWVTTTKVVWEQSGKVLFRSSYTVNGSDRINGCFDLARLDSKEALLSEIANDIKGRIDNAQQSISENAETVLGKVRSGEFDGRITGLRFSEQYFERYRIGEVERIDCHILGEIRQTDYNTVKSRVVNRIEAIDPKIKEAIRKRQIDFFSSPAQSEIAASSEAPITQNNADSHKPASVSTDELDKE